MEVKRLSYGPCIFKINAFADRIEANSLMNLLDDRRRYRNLKKSSSYYPVVRQLTRRVASILELPSNHVYASHIYRRSPGKGQSQHVDYLPAAETMKTGQRTWTLILGLSPAKPKHGGNFYFPKIDKKIHLDFGSALAWRNVTLDGIPDPDTVHKQFRLDKKATPRAYIVFYARSMDHAP